MPLHLAVEDGGNPAVVQALLDAGTDPNVKGGLYPQTPLISAVEGGNPAVVQALLDAGADPNAKKGFSNEPVIAIAVEEEGKRRGGSGTVGRRGRPQC